MQEEIDRLNEKFIKFNSGIDDNFSSIESDLENLRSELTAADQLTSEGRNVIKACVDVIKSKLSDHVKSHRELHSAVSKLGKAIDKKALEDFTSLATYFSDRGQKEPMQSEDGVAMDTDDPHRTPEELLHLVIVEHLLREGQEAFASELIRSFGFSEAEVKQDRFQELSDLVSTIQRGQFEYANNWLQMHRAELGSVRSEQLENTLLKLAFLSAMQRTKPDPASVIQQARQLLPLAQNHPDDFEHLMGSLVYLGQCLRDTPYADLCLLPADPDQAADPDQFPRTGGVLRHAASLFRSGCCARLSLSELDPLYILFTSGCRLLNRHQTLLNAISCLSKYQHVDGNTLPISVELDPLVHRHNIFHCPVIKEVTTSANGPVRLSCGHAISRAAFDSLPSGDRSKVKCPYCPVETFKSQALDLVF